MSGEFKFRNKRICEDRGTLTFRAIGEKYNISENRARQIVQREERRALHLLNIPDIKDGCYPDYFHFSDMDISFALHNALVNAGIERVGQAKDLRTKQLLKIKRIGYVALRELCNKIWGVKFVNLEKIDRLVDERHNKLDGVTIAGEIT